MSELFMECVEEDLEPWQKSVPQINLTEEDDDEPIFVGVVSKDQKESNTECTPALEKSEDKQDIRQPSTGPSQWVLPVNAAGKPVNTLTPAIPTFTPQPVIVNNQGFIVTPQMTNNSNVIASLGSHYPLGTSFALVSAAQSQVFQQIAPTTLMQSVVHRPQVQNISNNIVTLSNVQGPAVFNTQPSHIQVNQTNMSLPVMKQIPVKRVMPVQQIDNSTKKTKTDFGIQNSGIVAHNGMSKYECTNCKSIFSNEDGLKSHATNCKPTTVESTALPSQQFGGSKRIMLVGEFYYGQFKGNGFKKETEKATTFKCQSCLKVLKNNIRFMNHMKHHLELEKQSSESFESHTTCQHCYRQYLTPFQLQCHIESAHSAVESTTNCKICELAFESEQVLLDHMKNNHKPGEMPYVCQVCNFRSSFFSDVETHFRNAHENTKDILCPFCLKVFKSGHTYMQHYMRHQKKGIFRCGKCRLNFLSFKEKVEHRTQVHKTFRKPKALEGLAPGTKVTIRASLSGNNITPSATTPFGFIVSSDKSQSSKSVNVQKSQTGNSGPANFKHSQKQDRRTYKNHFLQHFRTSGKLNKCIECNGLINDFFSHFPMILHCGACKYKTNCKESIGNHMIRFHSTIDKSRFLKIENRRVFSSSKYSFHNTRNNLVLNNLVCDTCDLIWDESNGDIVAKHLRNRPNHTCRLLQDKAVKAKDQELPVEQPAELSTSSTEVPEDNGETLFVPSLPTAVDTSMGPPELFEKSASSVCEQENGSLNNMNPEESQEMQQPDLSKVDVLEMVSDENETITQ